MQAVPVHDNDNPPIPHGRSLGCAGRYPVHGTNEVCATFQFPSKSARRTYFVANRIIGPARRGEKYSALLRDLILRARNGDGRQI